MEEMERSKEQFVKDRGDGGDGEIEGYDGGGTFERGIVRGFGRGRWGC